MENIKLLILEDTDHNSYLDVIRLQSFGVIVASTPSVKEAFTICEQYNIHIIFVNLLGIDSNNFKNIKLLKSNSKTARIPIVSATFDSSDLFYKKALLVGSDLFVELPTPLDILLEKIKDVLLIPRRIHERIDISSNPGTVILITNEEIKGSILNISRTGMFISVDRKLKVSSTFDIKIILPDKSKSLSAQMTIIRYDYRGEDSPCFYGVEIKDVNPAKILEDYISDNSQRIKISKYYT
jgi:CheY-like chemotaxis protein